MDLILKKSKVDAFMVKMNALEKKFKPYLKGELSDHVKLNVANGNVVLVVDKKVPEMVRIACYIVFVQTLL